MDRKKLKAKIVENGFNQATISEKIGISLAAFNNKLNGKSSFTISEADKICDVLSITDLTEKAAIFLN